LAQWEHLEKEEINEAEREKKRKDERKVLTLTGLLMEGLGRVARDNVSAAMQPECLITAARQSTLIC
jgi:hypothetical protein